ncbi:circadian locomoter output cycles protein kaput isoform X13 [Drosophila mauritiana]|uniref:Circadian locomoter output cycles protein kaput isoform X13 n=1 Tax=Drosophila mauritiana TaxID=7226 RepID=A0A6P8JUT6_DROMA|nr:circadian locomoter output cycles protein kaput isoform X13 [Drosophila mauritiana]
MANVVNMNSLLNGKDSRWLQLEVCREFQRNKCSRQDTECKFAHPPANVEVQNGKVTACYDSIKATQLIDMDNFKGRCNRDKPPCKYFHPPQHLKDQLLINGRNHLALKNALMQQMGIAPGQPVISGQVPAVATNPYLTGIPANSYSPYYTTGHLVPALLGPDPVTSQLGPVVPQTVQVAQQKIPRSDRLETSPLAAHHHQQQQQLQHQLNNINHNNNNSTAGAAATSTTATTTTNNAAAAAAAAAAAVMGHHTLEVGKKRAADTTDMFPLMDVKTVGSFYYDNFQFSGMVPFKRPAAEKSGIPVYQPGATAYQQLMQPYVPVSYDKVEVIDQRVAVCRDHANSQCRRKQCKYYHIPIVLPPANIMAAMITSPSDQQPAVPVATTTANPAAAAAAAAATAAGYNGTSNLIIIEPQQQQQQPQQQQQQFSYHSNSSNNNYYHSNASKQAAHASNMYQQQQQHQQQQQQHQQHLQHQQHAQQQTHITYHCSSPYSPSSASSSSSCSIATSPTLSSATTLSTTSTATMPTPQQQYQGPAATATFLKAPAYYTDATPTLVLSSDYNSNCIPIQATPFISLQAAPQQHLLKYTTQAPPPQAQQHAFVGHHYQTQMGQVVATTVAAIPATTITVAPATVASPSTCI